MEDYSKTSKRIDVLEKKVILLSKAVQKLINVSGFNPQAKPPTIEDIKKAVLYGKAAIRGKEIEF